MRPSREQVKDAREKLRVQALTRPSWQTRVTKSSPSEGSMKLKTSEPKKEQRPLFGARGRPQEEAKREVPSKPSTNHGFDERLRSILDLGCQVFTDKGWGYIERRVFTNDKWWFDIRLEYVDDETRREELYRCSSDKFEAAAYCSIGNCLLTSVGTCVLVDFYRDTDAYFVRMGKTGRGDEQNHALLGRGDITRVISSAVGMIATTPKGLGDVVAYDATQGVFKVQLFEQPEGKCEEFTEARIETPLAKYVPAAEEMSEEGQLEDWKKLGQILFGSFIEAKHRTFYLCDRILGLSRKDIVGTDTSARVIFDKIKMKLYDLLDHPEKVTKYQDMIRSEFWDLADRTERSIENTPEGANLDNWIERFKEIMRQMGDAATRNPEIKQIVTDLRDHHRELFYKAVERSGYEATLSQHQARINELWARLRMMWDDPNKEQLLQIGTEIYDRLHSEEVRSEARAKGEALVEGIESSWEGARRQVVSEDEIRRSLREMLRRIDANKDEFDMALSRFEEDRMREDTADMTQSLHDFQVLLRRTLHVDKFSDFIGDRITDALQLMTWAMKKADQQKSSHQFEKTKDQLTFVCDYIYDVFTFRDEEGDVNIRVPQLEEVLCKVFEEEEKLREHPLAAQDLRDRFRNPRHGGTAALSLLRQLFEQISSQLPDYEYCRPLKQMLFKWANEPIRADDLMDAFVFTLSAENVAAWLPRALDMMEAVITKVEAVAHNEGLRVVLERAIQSGLHQKLLDGFQSIDESVLRRVSETGSRGDEARHELSKKFLDAAYDFLQVTLPNAPLPDVYEVNDEVEVAIANISLKDIEFRRDGIRVTMGGKKTGRDNTVNSLRDDSVISVRTKGFNTEMQDVMWKLRQLSFPYTDAYGLADIKIEGLATHLALKLVRIPRRKLQELEEYGRRADVTTDRTEFAGQSAEAASQSEQGYEIMFILKHAEVELTNMDISLHGSTSANILDVLTKLFTNAIRNAIRRQLSDGLRSNGVLFSGPVNEGFNVATMTTFIEQILEASVEDVPFVTEEELQQLREDAERYGKRSRYRSEKEWEESMREHVFTVTNRDDLRLEIVADPKTHAAGGAWKHGGFVQVAEVNSRSAFQKLLRQRKLESFFGAATVIAINGIDVTAKTPEETWRAWREAETPMEIKFALDARQWRRYLSDLGSERKREIRAANKQLSVTRVHLVGEGRITLEPSPYLDRATVLTGFNVMDFDMAMKLRPGMIVYSVADDIVLGQPYDKVAARIFQEQRPIALTFVDGPERSIEFTESPTDMILVHRANKLLVAGFERMPGLLMRSSPEIKVGDEVCDLDGRPFPGPFGYNQDIQRLRGIRAPATLGMGRYEGTRYKKFDVRITEDGMIGAIFGKNADGRPYIKGFVDVPGPGLSNPDLKTGDALLRINDVDVTQGMSIVHAEALLTQSEPPVTLRVLDVEVFDQLMRVRDGHIPLTEAA